MRHNEDDKGPAGVDIETRDGNDELWAESSLTGGIHGIVPAIGTTSVEELFPSLDWELKPAGSIGSVGVGDALTSITTEAGVQSIGGYVGGLGTIDAGEFFPSLDWELEPAGSIGSVGVGDALTSIATKMESSRISSLGRVGGANYLSEIWEESLSRHTSAARRTTVEIPPSGFSSSDEYSRSSDIHGLISLSTDVAYLRSELSDLREEFVQLSPTRSSSSTLFKLAMITVNVLGRIVTTDPIAYVMLVWIQIYVLVLNHYANERQ